MKFSLLNCKLVIWYYSAQLRIFGVFMCRNLLDIFTPSKNDENISTRCGTA